MTKDEIQSVIDALIIEGFDYTFVEYSTFFQIKDKEFHDLREKFLQARDNLEEYLENEAARHGVDTEEY